MILLDKERYLKVRTDIFIEEEKIDLAYDIIICLC